MTEAVTPFPVTPWPLTDARLALLKAAKARIHTDVKIMPVEALPGSPGRIFAWGVRPGWFCKTAPVAPGNEDSLGSIEAALRFWLDDNGFDQRFNEAWWLSSAMGCDVRLIAEEDHTGKVAFR